MPPSGMYGADHSPVVSPQPFRQNASSQSRSRQATDQKQPKQHRQNQFQHEQKQMEQFYQSQFQSQAAAASSFPQSPPQPLQKSSQKKKKKSQQQPKQQPKQQQPQTPPTQQYDRRDSDRSSSQSKASRGSSAFSGKVRKALNIRGNLDKKKEQKQQQQPKQRSKQHQNQQQQQQQQQQSSKEKSKDKLKNKSKDKNKDHDLDQNNGKNHDKDGKNKSKGKRAKKNKTQKADVNIASPPESPMINNHQLVPLLDHPAGGGGTTVSDFLQGQQKTQDWYTSRQNKSYRRKRSNLANSHSSIDVGNNKGEVCSDLDDSFDEYEEEIDDDDDNKKKLSTNGQKNVKSPIVDAVPNDHPSSSVIQKMRTCTLCHRTLPRSQFSSRDRYTIHLSLAPGAICRTCSMTVCAVRLKQMPGHSQMLLQYGNRGGYLQSQGYYGQVVPDARAVSDKGGMVPALPAPETVTGRELVPVVSNNSVTSSREGSKQGHMSRTLRRAMSAGVNAGFSGLPPEEDVPAHVADCKYIDLLLRMPCYANLNLLSLFQSSRDASVSLASLEAVRLYGTLDDRYFTPHDLNGDPRPSDRVPNASSSSSKKGNLPINPKSIVCLVIGDGRNPRTAVLAAMHYGWTTLSIDPKLSDSWDGYHDEIKGFTGYSGTIADFMNPGESTETMIEYSHQTVQHLVIIGIQTTKDQMRLRGNHHINEIRARYEDVPTTLVSLSPMRKASLAPRRGGRSGSRLERDVGYEPNCSYIDEGVFSSCRLVEVWNFHNADDDSESDYDDDDDDDDYIDEEEEYSDEDYSHESGEDYSHDSDEDYTHGSSEDYSHESGEYHSHESGEDYSHESGEYHSHESEDDHSHESGQYHSHESEDDHSQRSEEESYEEQHKDDAELMKYRNDEEQQNSSSHMGDYNPFDHLDDPDALYKRYELETANFVEDDDDDEEEEEEQQQPQQQQNQHRPEKSKKKKKHRTKEKTGRSNNDHKKDKTKRKKEKKSKSRKEIASVSSESEQDSQSMSEESSSSWSQDRNQPKHTQQDGNVNDNNYHKKSSIGEDSRHKNDRGGGRRQQRQSPLQQHPSPSSSKPQMSSTSNVAQAPQNTRNTTKNPFSDHDDHNSHNNDQDNDHDESSDSAASSKYEDDYASDEDNPHDDDFGGPPDVQQSEQVWEKAIAKHEQQESLCRQFEEYYGEENLKNSVTSQDMGLGAGDILLADAEEDDDVVVVDDNHLDTDKNSRQDVDKPNPTEPYREDMFDNHSIQGESTGTRSRRSTDGTASRGKRLSTRTNSTQMPFDDYSECGSNFVYDDGSSTSSGIAALSRWDEAPASAPSLGDIDADDDDMYHEGLNVWSDEEDIAGTRTPVARGGSPPKHRPWHTRDSDGDFGDSFHSYDPYD